MSINLKAKETLIQVGDLKGTYRFVLATEIYGKLSAARSSRKQPFAAVSAEA